MKDREKKSVSLREERDKALFDAYNKAVSENKFFFQEDAINYARMCPAPRFYINEMFCLVIINRMLKNEPWGVKGDGQMRRCADLFNLFKTECSKKENDGLKDKEICGIIVQKPAPEFYISYRTARMIIARERKRRCKELLERARR